MDGQIDPCGGRRQEAQPTDDALSPALGCPLAGLQDERADLGSILEVCVPSLVGLGADHGRDRPGDRRGRPRGGLVAEDPGRKMHQARLLPCLVHRRGRALDAHLADHDVAVGDVVVYLPGVPAAQHAGLELLTSHRAASRGQGAHTAPGEAFRGRRGLGQIGQAGEDVPTQGAEVDALRLEHLHADALAFTEEAEQEVTGTDGGALSLQCLVQGKLEHFFGPRRERRRAGVALCRRTEFHGPADLLAE